MSVLDRQVELVPVRLGFCPCEGTPHEDGDVVYLKPELTPLEGIRARSIVANWIEDGGLNAVEANVALAELWFSIGIDSWTFLADDGTSIPVTPENIVRALPYGKGGQLVADAADDLYTQMVIDPLVKKISGLSSDGSTATSVQASPNRATRRSSRKRS